MYRMNILGLGLLRMIDCNRDSKRIFLSDEFEYEIGSFFCSLLKCKVIVRLFKLSNGCKVIACISEKRASSGNDEPYCILMTVTPKGDTLRHCASVARSSSGELITCTYYFEIEMRKFYDLGEKAIASYS